MISFFSQYLKRKYYLPAGFIALFAVIGVLLLLLSHAATPYASIEPESGTTTGITSTTDSKASGGSYVQFGTHSTSPGGHGTGGSQGVCTPSACTANITPVTVNLQVGDGAGGSYTRSYDIYQPTNLQGKVPLVFFQSDGGNQSNGGTGQQIRY